MRTHYFTSRQVAPGADLKEEFRFLAAGVGANESEARADAARHMLFRWPDLWRSKLDDSPHKRERQKLLLALENGQVAGHRVQVDDGEADFGTGHFLNWATELVAVSYSSDQALKDALFSRPANVALVNRALENDGALICWGEIAECLADPSVAHLKLNTIRRELAREREVVSSNDAREAYLHAKSSASADISALQKLVLSEGNGKTATLFAAEVPEADVQALQTRVLAVGTGADAVEFAKRVPGANVEALQERILQIGDALDLVNFCKAFPEADHVKAQDKIIQLGTGSAIVMFAQSFPRADKQALQTRLLEIGQELDLYNFASTVPGCDVLALRDRHAQLSESPHWCAKFDELAKSHVAAIKRSAPSSSAAPPSTTRGSKPPSKPVVIASELADGSPVPKGKKIDADVLEVLESCRIDGFRVYLPATQLRRDLYDRVNEVLAAFGGQWKSGKVKAHVFQDDPAPLLEIAIGTGEFLRPQDFGYFPTGAREVERVMELADVAPGMNTLEPSAGSGAFALAMLQAVGNDPDLVTACELLPGNAKVLREAGLTKVIQGDFLSMEPQPIFDRVIMNPPFNGGIDVDHVLHATKFLNAQGRLTAITSVGWTHNSTKKATAFRDFVNDVDGFIDDIEAGAFKDAGTNVATKILCIEAENLPWYRDSQTQQPPAPGG